MIFSIKKHNLGENSFSSINKITHCCNLFRIFQTVVSAVKNECCFSDINVSSLPKNVAKKKATLLDSEGEKSPVP